MIESLFDDAVAIHLADPDTEPGPVMGAESGYLEAMRPSRLREFSAGRSSARLALARLGSPAVPILRDEQRVPIWPEGFVGSITHCDGFCAAAVARVSQVAALGIDAECLSRFDPDLSRSICSPEEEAHFRSLEAVLQMDWRTLVFSAKESFYKAWYPNTRTPLGFTEVDLHLTPGDSTFLITVMGEKGDLAPWGATASGSYVVGAHHVVTGVAVPVRSI